MRTATVVTRWIVRVGGILQIVLGLLIWAGPGLAYLQIHISTGFVIVLCLWTLAVLALVARAGAALAIFALAWGVALPVFGFAQMGILVGPWHWIIRVVHLLMGLVALGVADRLATRLLEVRR